MSLIICSRCRRPTIRREVVHGQADAGYLLEVPDAPSWPVSLALYDSLRMRIVFSPLDTGSVSASLIVTSNDPETPSAAIALQGTGVRIASAVPGVIYAVQVTRSSEEFIYFLNDSGEIRSATSLSIPGLQALSVGAWNARLYGAAQANHRTRIVWIDGSDGRLLALVDNSLVRMDTSTGNGSFRAYVALEGLRAIAAGQPSTGVGGDGRGFIPDAQARCAPVIGVRVHGSRCRTLALT